MWENIIQAFSIVVLCVVSSALPKEATVPDTKMFNCSFDVQVDEFPSRINLCSLKGVVYLNVYSDETSSVGNSPSIYIHRYYLINAFGKIQGTANKHNKVPGTMVPQPDLSGTNCPLYSTSCLVSEVAFPKCNNNNQDDDGVCYNDNQTTADSYGWQRRWNPNVVCPPERDGSTVSITMQGGPCYYCDDTNLKLSTVIRFYCDERRTGIGKLIRKHDPTKSKPNVLLHWNTSAACYQFKPNEQCDFPDFLTTTCNKSFGCKSNQGQYHQYRWPPSANNPINFSNPSTTYTFGFCARNVQCPTDDNDVMICRKDGQESKALAYYSDVIGFIARPTGFVIRIIDKQSRHLKGVISFECLTSTDVLSKTVLDNNDHKCFCPDRGDGASCQAEPATSPSKNDKVLLELLGAVAAVCVIVAILLYVRHRRSTRSTTRVEVPPPNNGCDGVGDDGDQDRDHDRQPEGREGDRLLNASPSSTYHSCHSDDTMLSCISRGSNDANSDERTRPSVDGAETQESSA